MESLYDSKEDVYESIKAVTNLNLRKLEKDELYMLQGLLHDLIELIEHEEELEEQEEETGDI